MEEQVNQRIPPIIHQSWHPHLQPLFNNPLMTEMRDVKLPGCYYYPEAKSIFKVFAMPIDKVKVVILGQDPYSNQGEAIGKAFAVAEEATIPVSLRIMRNELIRSGAERLSSVSVESPKWRTLQHWSMQGVFLLNTALTVQRKDPGSHIGMWLWFTRELIPIISREAKPIWMLWGAKALAFKYLIRQGVVTTAPHPAAETYGSGKSFTGSNQFVICNKLLKESGKSIINW